MNNSIIEKTIITSSITSSVNINNTQLLPLEQGMGQKSVYNTPIIAISNQAIIERKIESECFLDGNERLNYCRNLYLREEIRLLVQFINESIDPDFTLNVDEITTFRALLEKQGELHAFLMYLSPEIKLKHKNFLHNVIGPAVATIVEENIEGFGGKDMARNMFISFSVYREVYLKYYEFSDERNETSSLNFKNSSSDDIIEGFDSIIDNALKNLRKIVNDKYYSLLSSLLDLDISLDDKAKIFLKYLYQSDAIDTMSSEVLFKNFGDPVCFSKISNMACYVMKLQILIDVLTEIKKSPKTLENLKIVLGKSQNALSYYEEDTAQYHMWCKKNNAYGSFFYKDFCEVKSSLNDLVSNLNQLKVQASFSTSTSTRSIKNKGNKKAQGNKNNKKQVRQRKLLKVTTSAGEKKQEKSPASSCEATKFDEIKTNTINNELLMQKQEEVLPKISNLVLSIDSEEDSIERENSELFESIRQLIENDRKAKLELKELKAARKKQREDDENKIIIIEKKPKIIKLSTGHQSTLDAIFSEEDCHLKLSGSEIENLINALGGKAKPGSKKKINIFWGNSTKKAGSYEITHGGDSDGLLTRDYVERVKKAILAGVQLDYIAKETMHYAL